MENNATNNPNVLDFASAAIVSLFYPLTKSVGIKKLANAGERLSVRAKFAEPELYRVTLIKSLLVIGDYLRKAGAHGESLRILYHAACYAPAGSDEKKSAAIKWYEGLQQAPQEVAQKAVLYALHHEKLGAILKPLVREYRLEHNINTDAWDDASKAAKAAKKNLVSLREDIYGNELGEAAKKEKIEDFFQALTALEASNPDLVVPLTLFSTRHAHYALMEASKKPGVDMSKSMLALFELMLRPRLSLYLNKMVEENPEGFQAITERNYGGMTFKDVIGENFASALIAKFNRMRPEPPAQYKVQAFVDAPAPRPN